MAYADEASASKPVAISGELSAPNWSFFDDPPLEIVGDWEVVWGQLVDPSDFDNVYQEEYFTLPARWNGVAKEGIDGAYGAATFRARLKLADYNRDVAYHLIAPHGAYRLYIDGVLVINNGTVATSREGFQANYVSRTFAGESGESEIVFQVANFAHAYGGPGHALTLWDAKRLDQFLDWLSVIYGLVAGIMFTIGLFHFILYFADRKNRAQSSIHLWFAILCFIIVYRVQGVIPFFHDYFPDNNYWGDLRGTYLSLYAAPAVYLLFFRSVFPRIFPQKMTLILIYVCLAGLVFTLFSPQNYYTLTRNFSIFLNVFAILYSLIFTVLAVRAQQAGALVILISNFVFLLTALNDAFIYTDQGSGFDMTPFGILVLGLGYSYALLLRLQETFKEARTTSIALESLNQDLEAQVRDRTRAFKAAAAKAENASEERARFIAAASHDLRQPLHALAMFNATLKGKIASEREAILLEKQGAAITNLGQLLQDTLDTAQADIQQKVPDLKSLAVKNLLKKVINGFEPKAQSREVVLSNQCDDGFILTDNVMLQRVLGNLLDNALKAAKRSVKLSAHQDDENWVFTIEDDGQGIAETDVGRIFDSYVTLQDPVSSPEGGYGLGLYVVKEFTRLLGGEIHVESRLGKGSLFTVSIPHEGVSAPQLSSDAEIMSADKIIPKDLKILAIDDELPILEAMSALIESWGAQIASATDLAKAETILANGYQPDIFLVDYHLHGANGMDVVKALNEKIARAIPAIIITGATEAKLTMRIERAAYPILYKPIVPGQLAQAIKQALSV